MEKMKQTKIQKTPFANEEKLINDMVCGCVCVWDNGQRKGERERE